MRRRFSVRSGDLGNSYAQPPTKPGAKPPSVASCSVSAGGSASWAIASSNFCSGGLSEGELEGIRARGPEPRGLRDRTMSKFVLQLDVLDATVRDREADLNVELLWFAA
jgi:hypothetical protein